MPRPSSAIDSAVDVSCELPIYAKSRVVVSSRTSTTKVTIAIVAAGRCMRAGQQGGIFVAIFTASIRSAGTPFQHFGGWPT